MRKIKISSKSPAGSVKSFATTFPPTFWLFIAYKALKKKFYGKKLFLRSFNGIFNRTIHSATLNIKVLKQKNELPTSAILGAFDCKNKFNGNFFRRKILALREVTYFTGVNFEYVFYGAFHRNRLAFRKTF